MNVTFQYAGRSDVIERGGAQTLHLVPNLTRDAVAFDAPLRQPLRFREAISALHDTVISDLRFKKRDKSVYLQWKKDVSTREGQLRRQAYEQALAEINAKRNAIVGSDLERTYNGARKRY